MSASPPPRLFEKRDARNWSGHRVSIVNGIRETGKRAKLSQINVRRDKGYFAEGFINKLFDRTIEPHVAAQDRGKADAHRRVRMRERGQDYKLSQRNRKKIEELFGEGKDNHGLRRVRRRFLDRVGQEILLIATVLNYKRLAAAVVRA
jgi:IS5 family transposase